MRLAGYTSPVSYSGRSDSRTRELTNSAAILTKFKTPDMEKPVIRPYTPVNDEGSTYSLVLLRSPTNRPIQVKKATSTSW